MHDRKRAGAEKDNKGKCVSGKLPSPRPGPVGLLSHRTPPDGQIGGPLASRLLGKSINDDVTKISFTEPGGLPAEATIDGPAVLRKVIYNSLKDGKVDMDTVEGIECFNKTM